MHVLRLFRDDEDYQAAIFAENHRRAAEIWEAIGERFWLMPAGWIGGEVEAWELFGKARHKRVACERCIEGIGIYDASSGWEILPLDYDAIGMVPPPGRRH